MIPRDALRVRRWIDDELVDELPVGIENVGDIALEHGEWARMVADAGSTYRVIVDDPAGDIGAALIFEGGPT